MGAAYVWGRRGDTWIEQAFIKASNPDLEDWFSVRLALSRDGSRLFVGAAMEDSAAKGINGAQDDDSAEDSGAAYLYERSGMTWRQLGLHQGVEYRGVRRVRQFSRDQRRRPDRSGRRANEG